MADKNNSSKLKILYLRQILEDETDAEHGLTMSKIIQRLAEYGIEAERKGIYRDFAALKEFGIDVDKKLGKYTEYSIKTRYFELPELMLLVDAVESCKSLTQRQSNKLIANLKTFASENQRKMLDRNIHVDGRISSKNESVFQNIDILHDAMRMRRRIEFKYYKFGPDGKRHATNNGKPHCVTPVGIQYSDGYYYLSAWNDNHSSMSEYRIDRMDALTVSDEAASINNEITHHTYDKDDFEMFGHFAGEPTTVTLLVDADKIEIIIDRFGSGAEIFSHNDTSTKAIVKVRKSEQFFGWVAGLGGTVRIESPATLKDEYIAYLRRLIGE